MTDSTTRRLRLSLPAELLERVRIVRCQQPIRPSAREVIEQALRIGLDSLQRRVEEPRAGVRC